MEIKTLTHQQVLDLLPNRDIRAHKGNFGRILMLCGSRGYTGAAALAAMGALRAGAGLVYLGIPNEIYPIMAVKLTEPVVFPLPDKDGMLSEAAVKNLAQLLPRMDVVLIGPGLGKSAGILAVVEYVLENFKGPVVLDADGINVLKLHKDILRDRTSATILTPHEGEFKRIGGEIAGDRISAAAKLALDLKVIIVLKGYETVITDGKNCYINKTGNPGMAVGGSGDVLAGMIAALLGQSIDPLYAAACAVWLHGAAGDLCASQIGQYGMLPSDMLQVLPRLLK